MVKCMKKLPKTNFSLLLRTDFSDDSAWKNLCEAIEIPSEEGFLANLDYINEPSYDGLTVDQCLALVAESGEYITFIFLADSVTLTHPEQPILVIDLYDKIGETFRVIPREIWGVQNNLSIANKDFYSFVENVDLDGIFRGFS